MVIHKNFDHKDFESDIKKLSVEIAEKRNLLEHKNLSDRELIKQTLTPTIKQAVVSGQQSDMSGKLSNVDNKILPDYLKDALPDIKLQVKNFIDLAFHQGIEAAVKAVSNSDAFIIDAFHDALTDKLYEELKKRNLL
ncbi:hypothetical protein HZB04_01050 [Candidatus Wolfebacteria bacterium]|nr:hypothetical protein [Candidatus Wolfebacteria bacterium]